MINIRSNHHTPSVGRTSSSSSSTRDLANTVVTAAKSSQKINTQAANIAQLRLSNLKLHGRDDDIKLLRCKFLEVAKKKGNDVDATQNNGRNDDEPDPNKKSTNNNLILVSGISGTGKSALIRKGLGEPATKNGYVFASGKFDEKLSRPLSAFSDAMTSLAKHITVESNEKRGLSIATLIQDKIRDEFDGEDMEQLRRVLPGCAELLRAGAPMAAAPSRNSSVSKLGSLNLPAGTESIAQMHYAIRRLLKIVCSYLKGAVLFIDDLQWSDAATLDLLKSIVLDGEIPSLLIVGAYREDEVPE